MKVRLVIGMLLLSLSAPERVLEDCTEVGADAEAESPLIAGLDSAFALASSLPFVSFCLTPSEVPFYIGNSAVVRSSVLIRGNGQILILRKMISIAGNLTVLNLTLTTSVASAEFSTLALIGGFLRIEDSLVDTIGTTFASGSGSIIFKGTNFTNNEASIVSISYQGESTVQILHCSVWNHTDEFVRVLSPFQSGNISVSIDHTTFRENKGSGFLITCLMPSLSGNFIVVNSGFISNRIPLFYLDIGDMQVSIAESEFSNNNQTSLIVHANEANFTIEDSSWSGNSHIVFDFRQFTGDLFVSRITVADQRWKGIFQIQNNLLPDQCHFTMQDSSFLDTYFKVNEPSPGAIHVFACMTELTRTAIRNVRMAAVHQRDLEALIFLRLGNLVISQMTLRSSGSVSIGVGVALGNFSITDSFLYDLQSGGGGSVVCLIGSMSVQNVSITQGAQFPLDEVNIGVMSMYFIASSSRLKVRNVSILPVTWVDRANPIFAVFSILDIIGMSVYSHRFESVVYMLEAEGSIANITVRNCVLDYAVFYLNNYNLVRISGVTIRDSSIGLMGNCGFFKGTPSLHVDCDDLSVTNVTANYFVASKHAQMRLRNVSITGCRFQFFMKNQLNSNITIENMTVRRSTEVLAFLFQSSLRIVDSSFEDFESGSVIFGGENVNLTLDRVVIKNASSPLGFSNFKENSQLTITQSEFSGYQSAADEGFYHNTGTIIITDSTFHSFNTVFIQAVSCSVYIGNSVFHEGRSKALSPFSASAHGGALACIDCSSLVIEHSSFLNVSAVFGGAVAVWSFLETLSIRITDCEFVMCSATAGGALYLKDTAFNIEESKFIGNEAVSTGGAIDVYSSDEQLSLIRSCQFHRNRAHEGGAVKWNKAKVSFINVTFQENSATYGPDIASYGIKLCGKVTSANGAEASGYPLRLIFELQDHYAQRVTTASTQYFQLLKSNQVDFLGNTAATISQGIFNFSQLTIYAQPNSKQSIVGAMATTQNKQIVTVNASVEVTFRDCVPGEVRKADRCEFCFAGNVSFFPLDSDCSYCPKHAFCPGGNVLLVDPGYWRNNDNSTKILPCPLRTNCLGGQHSECAEGYTGQVCNECSVHSARLRTLECEPCGNLILQWAKVLVVLVPILGFNAAVKSASAVQFFLLKQFVNHAQLLSSLSYLRVAYPPVIRYSLHSLSYLSSLFIADLPLSCLSSSKQPEYGKAIIGSATPLSFFAVLLLLNRRNMKKAWTMCTSAMMFTPAIALLSQMPLLACQSVQSAEERLFVDMQEQCWQGSHLLLIRALVLPSVLLNVILPTVLVSLISVVSPQRFDLLFPLWRSGVKWRSWDLLICCAKILLNGVLVVSITVEQLCQVAYGLVVLIFVSVVTAGLQLSVYIHWKWFFLVEYSLVIVSVSMGLCVYFLYHAPGGGLTDWLISGVFLLLNVGYFAVCAKLWVFPPNLGDRGEVSQCEIAVPPNSVSDSFNL